MHSIGRFLVGSFLFLAGVAIGTVIAIATESDRHDRIRRDVFSQAVDAGAAECFVNGEIHEFYWITPGGEPQKAWSVKVR
jgi:hypothetical protein